MDTVPRRCAALLIAAYAGAASAQTTMPEATREEPPQAPAEAEREYGRLDFKVDPDAYSIISNVRGVSTHKSTYFYPVSWSPDFKGNHSELVFQVSAKWRVFGSNFYVAYSQRSFWQWLNSSESSPFRETNHDPEVFYRWLPDPKEFNHWGADFGAEHESNGRAFPESRSWNRLYFAPFHAKGRTLAYLKFWYRIPEGEPSTAGNQNADDNPDITDYMGYGEMNFSRQIGRDQLLSAMVRANPTTGHGAVSVTWSVPSKEGWVFWGGSVFHGYGESLILYDQEVTRVMVGVLFSR